MLLKHHRLSNAGWFYSSWTVFWLSWMLLNCQTLAEPYAGWFYFNCYAYWVTWLWWNLMIWAVFLVTLLLEHFGECTIRETVLLEYLDRLFGCLLFYNSLIFHPILLSFGKHSFLCLVHLHSNFQLFPPCGLCDIGKNSYAKSITQFFNNVGLSFIYLLSLIWSISNHQKALLWCLT